MTEETKNIIYLIGSVVLMPVTFVIEPFVIRQLWIWYVHPLGLPMLTWAAALGLDMLASVLTFRWPGHRSEKDSFQSSFANLVNGLIALGIGWLVLRLRA